MGWNRGLAGRHRGSCGRRDRCAGYRQPAALSHRSGRCSGHDGDRERRDHRRAPAPTWPRRSVSGPRGNGLGGSGDSHGSTFGRRRRDGWSCSHESGDSPHGRSGPGVAGTNSGAGNCHWPAVRAMAPDLSGHSSRGGRTSRGGGPRLGRCCGASCAWLTNGGRATFCRASPRGAGTRRIAASSC
jgi:hypothetical protein